MNYTLLQNEISNDPTGQGYSTYLPDSPGKVVELLNTQSHYMVKSRMITARGIMSGIGPVAGAARLSAAIMGLSLGTTIGSAFSKQSKDMPASNFDNKMNVVDQNAMVPAVYGTRKIGGLQSYHSASVKQKLSYVYFNFSSSFNSKFKS